MEIRQQLIDKTIEFCAINSIYDISDRILAKYACTKLSVLKKYFNNCDDLMFECYLSTCVGLTEQLKTTYNENCSIEDLLSHIWYTYIDYLGKNINKTIFADQYCHSREFRNRCEKNLEFEYPFFNQCIRRRLLAVGGLNTNGNAFLICWSSAVCIGRKLVIDYHKNDEVLDTATIQRVLDMQLNIFLGRQGNAS